VLLLAIGIGIGYKLATKMRQDDPNVVASPRRDSNAVERCEPSRRRPSAWRPGHDKSLDLLRRAREPSAIGGRLRKRPTPVWN